MKYAFVTTLSILAFILLLSAVQTSASDKVEAVAKPYQLNQTIYYNGDIITMEGDEPEYVEAVVQREGQIIFVGSKDEAFKRFEGKAKKHDLGGKTMLPGFIDGHGHIYNMGLMSLMANILPLPDGPGEDFDSIIDTTKKWMESKNGKLLIKKFGWVLANGFDDSQLTEEKYPTAEILDKITTQYPVAIIHQSGHLAVVNSKALELVGYTKETQDPKGGVIRRNNSGIPNGVLEESAFFNAILPIIANSDDELMSLFVRKGQEEYVKNGYTTAQDGRTTADASKAFATAARNNEIFIDIVSYPDIVWNKDAVTDEFYNNSAEYTNHYRIGGVKLTLDGSPQGKTAWLTHSYHIPPEGESPDYKGYPIMSDADAGGYVKTAFKNRWQIIAHTNGDAAIDQYLKAVKAAIEEYGYDDHRTVLIHGQTLRKDQIPYLKELEIYPSLFPMHTFYWGDWHKESVLGSPRADYISPTRDVVDAGLTITSHHDAPVTFPNAMRVLDATVNRVTRSGKVLGKDQRLTPYEGLKTLTEWSAKQHFEENKKGTLKVGHLADFVILSKNPLKINPYNINDIKIIKTIKEGVVVYQ